MKLSLIDRIFTATSATCVTGLTVINIYSKLSLTGQLVLLTLIQLGGLGLMVFSTVLFLIIGKKISLQDKITLKESLNKSDLLSLTSLIKYIIIFTFSMEILGAGILFFKWKTISPPLLRLYFSIFHSISAFCNAGFSLFSNSLIRYANDPVTILTISLLVIIGGLGFFVNFEIRKFFKYKLKSLFKKPENVELFKFSLHSKTVISMTIILILIGIFFLGIFEYNNILIEKNIGNKFLIVYYQSITARTAGFNTVSIFNLSNGSLLILILLMFIGGSPGSTAGGIKTTTFSIVFFVIRSFFQGKDKVVAFYRTIKNEIIQKTLTIFILALSVNFVGFLLILAKEGDNFSFISILFEVVSAFGTVGLSTGITPLLSTFSKIIIILLMFLGRIGPLTLAISLIKKETGIINYPEENVSVG